MTLVLHLFSGAPRGWRVHLGLEFKGLAYSTRYLSASQRDHHKPDFVALNPRSRIPVLETPGGPMRESIAILAWLDRAFPDRPLFGEHADEAAEIWPLTLDSCDFLRDANAALLPLVFPSEDTVPAADSEALAQLRGAAERMHMECRQLDVRLADGRTYLAGAQPTAADAVIYPEVRLLERAMQTKPARMAATGFADLEALYPHLAAWSARLAAEDRVARTLPPHWQS